jgi:hypothetical protein
MTQSPNPSNEPPPVVPMAGGAVPLELTPEQKARADEKIQREDRVRTVIEEALSSGAYLIASWYITKDKQLIYTPFMFNFQDGDMPTAVRQLKNELSGALRRKTEQLANQVEGSVDEADVAREAEVAAAVAEDENGQQDE